VFRHDQVELVGGGGTDMGAIIDSVDQEKDRSDLIICVTDGYTPWTDRKTKAPVVVALTRKDCLKDVPKWMKTVCLEK
jgi:predicted metal-dependent peptidase